MLQFREKRKFNFVTLGLLLLVIVVGVLVYLR